MFVLAFVPEMTGQWLDGYCYRKQITINHSQVTGSSNHTNFPVLINIASDTDLEDEAHGGYVNESHGWDLVFTGTSSGL